MRPFQFKIGILFQLAVLVGWLVATAPTTAWSQQRQAPRKYIPNPIQTISYIYPDDPPMLRSVLEHTVNSTPVIQPNNKPADPFAKLGIDDALLVKSRGVVSREKRANSRVAPQRSTINSTITNPIQPRIAHRQDPEKRVPSGAGTKGNAAPPRFNTPPASQPLALKKQVPSTSVPAKSVATKSNAPKSAAPSPPTQDGKISASNNFTLAGQPKVGDHFFHHPPQTGKDVHVVPYSRFDFPADPIQSHAPYDPGPEMQTYQGKTLNANQRPLLEIGRPWYQLGQLSPGYKFLGAKNLVVPQFIVHGDFRSAVSSATQNADNQNFWSFEANLFFDFKFTSTERIVFNMTPFDNGVNNSKFLLDRDFDFDNRLNPNINFGYLEGDLGALWGGLVGENLPFDAPFAAGFMPLLFQNGVWLEDAFVGVAYTIPARNSPLLDISNMDITFFYAWDEVTSPAFPDDDVDLFGIAAFVEAMGGYFELDYAFLEDQNQARDLSYHNISIAYSRRYGRFISNSIRVIANAGQESKTQQQTADGVLLLIENSFTTANPLTFVPYFNMFAGFDRPQSAARAGFAGGVLRNTGILFETDGMTGFPTLDDTGNDTYGGAIGFNILAKDFSQQLILEAAYVGVHGNDLTRNARGDQYGLGFRYQLPITNADLIRLDGIIGFFENDNNVNGIRLEYRHKW